MGLMVPELQARVDDTTIVRGTPRNVLIFACFEYSFLGSTGGRSTLFPLTLWTSRRMNQ